MNSNMFLNLSEHDINASFVENWSEARDNHISKLNGTENRYRFASIAPLTIGKFSNMSDYDIETLCDIVSEMGFKRCIVYCKQNNESIVDSSSLSRVMPFLRERGISPFIRDGMSFIAV